MNDKKNKEYAPFSTTVPHKFLKTLKLHAFKDDTSMGDILVRYQNSYLREIEREKAEKKAKKSEQLLCPYYQKKTATSFISKRVNL